MRVVIGGNTQRYMEILGIKSYPFTPEELKYRFRSLIKQYHSDINKNSDDSDTKKIIEAYNNLKNLAVSDRVSEEEKQNQFDRWEKENKDLFTLWDTCPHCEGTGKVTRSIYHKATGCKFCNYTGTIEIGICFDCHGSGRFKQRKSGKIVTCRTCGGTGRSGYEIECPHCSFEEKLVDCSYCKGTGKIEVKPFNPVIKKASVMI